MVAKASAIFCLAAWSGSAEAAVAAGAATAVAAGAAANALARSVKNCYLLMFNSYIQINRR